MITKVKGHATEEPVAEGEVEQDDKAAIDKADEAAERGSGKEQENLAIVAGLYSRDWPWRLVLNASGVMAATELG